MKDILEKLIEVHKRCTDEFLIFEASKISEIYDTIQSKLELEEHKIKNEVKSFREKPS